MMTPPVPQFAERFDPDTFMQVPEWVERGSYLDRMLVTLRDLNDPMETRDVAAVWQKLIPIQRQDLAARGWTTTDSRKSQVLLKVSQDVPATTLYFRVQRQKRLLR